MKKQDMTLRTIKRTKGAVDKWGGERGWVVFYEDETNRIIEIKSLYNPNDYNGDLPLLNDDEIIKLLQKEKNKLKK